jgi:hypothetical protein
VTIDTVIRSRDWQTIIEYSRQVDLAEVQPLELPVSLNTRPRDFVNDRAGKIKESNFLQLINALLTCLIFLFFSVPPNAISKG